MPASTAPLYRLLYCSRISPAAEGDIASTLSSILEASVRNNQTEQLSGVLVAHRGWFIQALEGPESALQARYAIIRQDRRHAELRSVSWGPAADRAFPRWSMCAQDLSATDKAILTTLSYRDNFDPGRWNETVVMRLLGAVCAIHSRALSDGCQKAGATKAA